MGKKIFLAAIILAGTLAAGCGNNQLKPQSLNNLTPPKAKPTGEQLSASQNRDYSKYKGIWVTENNLIDDYTYGIVLNIDVDSNGNLEGTVSNSTENLTHVSNVDLKGRIKDNQLIDTFNEDDWGHSGTVKLLFKESRITLTIDYNSNSSKDDLWGIGKGSFTLINNSTKVTRTLDSLKNGGLQVIENQCFPVQLENYGKVRFISGLKRENCNDNADFYLIDDNNKVLYKFPDFYGNKKGAVFNIAAVSFVDANNDGLKDIIIIANCNTDSVPDKPITISSIYFQKGKEFMNNENFDDKLNTSRSNKEVALVLKYSEDNLTK